MDIEDEVIDALDAEAILALLPEKDRKIILMRFYNGMTFKEIADTLDISYNAAWKRYKRAILKARCIVKKK